MVLRTRCCISPFVIGQQRSTGRSILTAAGLRLGHGHHASKRLLRPFLLLLTVVPGTAERLYTHVDAHTLCTRLGSTSGRPSRTGYRCPPVSCTVYAPVYSPRISY